MVHLMEEGAPNDQARSITYTAQGEGAMDGWYIHLLAEPVYEGNGGVPTSEAVHLFYGEENDAPAVMS